MEINGKTVAVIGAGRSGLAAARLVLESGGRARLSESGNGVSQDLSALAGEAPGGAFQFETGGHHRGFLEGSDLMVVSPGVPLGSEPVIWAGEWGIPVWGEIELAFRFCRCPVIAVTGSNGKTTVSTLIHRVLEQAGRRVALAGNIGFPFCAEAVARSADLDMIVLEVSSFQMETIASFRPRIAVWLNFSQNHLDRHRDLQDYFNAKSRIFMNQTEEDYAVINARDRRMKDLLSSPDRGGIRAQVVWFNDGSCEAENPNHEAVKAVARITGVDPFLAEKICRDFEGVEHRMEICGQRRGVEFINDSKSTTPEAGLWALNRTASPVVMICGGRDKNTDFAVLRDKVKEKVRELIVFGESAEKLARTFEDLVPVRRCPDLPSAVAAAAEAAQNGDRVLLSPMCASFDQFKNYEERGRRFKQLVGNV